jgi:hypothetical protein
MAVTIINSPASKRPQKTSPTNSNLQLYADLNKLLNSRTLGRVFSEALNVALWAHRTQTRTNQIVLARLIGAALDKYAENNRQNAEVTK